MKTSIRLYLITALLLISYLNLKAQNMEFYTKKWQKVDSLEQKALPKSALEVVNEILDHAKAENNSEQVIKSFIFRLKYKNSNEEKAFEKLCYEMDSAIQTAKFPDNAIMHSMLAEMYWWYYQSNRYKFYNRSNTINFDNKDMETWSLDNLVDIIIKEYKLALTDKEALQKIGKDQYKELIYPGTKPKELRPTLYDFLAHRALDFFTNTEIALTKPADYFQLQEDFYFADAKIFANQDIQTNDTLSLHFHYIKLIQDIFKYRLGKENEPDAMLDIDLKRLVFVNTHSVNSNKDELYFQALKRLETNYQKTPYVSEVLYKLAEYYNRLSANYIPLQKETEKYKNYKNTAHEICLNLIKNYPNSNAASFAQQLKIEIETHNLVFETESIIATMQKFASKVSYRNAGKIFVRVAKMDFATYNKLAEKYYSEELYEKVLKLAKTVYEQNHTLPVDNDFNQHSVEILLDPLPVGFYVMFVSDNEGFSCRNAMASYQGFRVSGISYITQKVDNGAQRFIVMDRTTGWPLAGVSCQSWYTKYSYASRRYIRKNGSVYTSDKDGMVVLKATSGGKDEQWSMDFRKGNDFLSTENTYYAYKTEETKYSRINTTFFTDRAIYRPSQTIFFKGISIRTEGDKHDVEVNSNVTVYLYDVNRQKVSELALKTNEFGTFSGKFDIPLGLLNGNFTIECSTGSKSISVEEYKRPKFEVKMLPFKGNYLVNDDVEVTGTAISYSGAALSDAQVKYRIIRTPSWRGWWSWRFNPVSVEIKNGLISTGDDGHFKINFKAIPDLALGENEYLMFSYAIVVDVTDLNGETQSTSSSINVGYRALQVSLPIEDLINKTDKKYTDLKTAELVIGTQNLNYEFIPAKGDIKIYKLKSLATAPRERHWERPDKHIYTFDDWAKLFPGNLFDNENEVEKSEKDKEVFASKFDTELNKKLDFSMVKSFETGTYVAEISSKDAFGNSVMNKHFFKVYSHEQSAMSYPEIGMFTPVNIYCEPGDSAKFVVGSSMQNVKILYEIEHKGKIISTEILSINNEQKLISILICVLRSEIH